MPSAARRRRTVQEEDSDSGEDRRQTQTQSTQTGRRRSPTSEDGEVEDEDAEEEGEDGMDVDGENGAESNPQDQIVKKMVRYALACEYQRVSIKRAGVTEKVIGKQRGTFKRVFEGAQQELRHKFGMQMVPLPVKEKVTMKEKRAAAKSNSNSKSTTTTSYILTSIIPPQYKAASIMPPSIISSPKDEAQYMAICMVIVSLISLAPGGSFPDSRLRHQLKRLFIDTNTPVGKLEDVLSRMRKEGYVIYVKGREGDGDETVDWYVGGRGKVEISSKCIRGFVHEVYGESAPEDLDKRLQRSLGLEIRRAGDSNEEEDTDATNGNGNGHANGDPGPSNGNARGRRWRAAAAHEDDG